MRSLSAFVLAIAFLTLVPALSVAAPVWQEGTLASAEGTVHLFPAVASGPDGQIVAAWREGAQGPLQVARWLDGTWETLGVLSAAEAGVALFQDGLSLAVAEGAIHVALRGASGPEAAATRSIVHAVLQDGQWTPHTITSVQNNNGDIALDAPSLILGLGQTPQVAFTTIDCTEGRRVELVTGTFENNGWLLTTLRTETGASALIEGTSLALDNEGATHLAFTVFDTEVGRRQLIYGTDAGGALAFEVVDDGDGRTPRGGHRLLIDAQGSAAIAYYDALRRDARVALGPGEWTLLAIDGQENTDRGRGIDFGANSAGAQAFAYLAEPERSLVVATAPALGNLEFQTLVEGIESAPTLAVHVTPFAKAAVLSQHWNGETTELRFHIDNLPNLPPVVAQGTRVEVTMDEDATPQPFSLTLQAQDPNRDRVLIWRLVDVPQSGQAAAAGEGDSATVSYVPEANFNGEDTFTIEVADTYGGTTLVTVVVAVTSINDLPTITEGEAGQVTMSEDGTPTPFALSLSATDIEDDPAALSWAVVTQAQNGRASVEGDGALATVGFVPTQGFSGVDSFVLEVRDTDGGTDQFTVNVTVEAVNDPPVIDPDQAQIALALDEDASASLSLSATDTDHAPETLVWSVAQAPSNGTAEITGEGGQIDVAYTPEANFNGSDTFTVEVADPEGATDTIEVQITVNAINDLPIIAQGALVEVTMSEDGAPTPFALELLAEDADHDGAQLTWRISVAAGRGVAEVDQTGGQVAVGYAPEANFNGSDTFTVEVADPEGATDTIEVVAVVAPVNDAPTNIALDPAFVEVNALAGTEVGVLSVADVDAGDTHTFALVAGEGDGDNARFEIVEDRLQTAEDLGPEVRESFSVRVEVSDGLATLQQVLSISVGAIPVAEDDAFEVLEGQVLTVPAPGVLGNDVLGEGETLLAVLGTQPEHGTLAFEEDGGFVYTPEPAFNGQDSFTYQADDGAGLSAPAVVTLEVRPVNEAPRFVAPTPEGILEIIEGNTLSFEVVAEDPDGDEITLSVAGAPPGADFDPATGIYNHTPTFDEAGIFDVTFTVSDGVLEATRELVIEVRFLDADGDGLPGTWEEMVGMDRNNPDSDGDNIGDFEEVGGDLDTPLDTDEDGIIDALDEDSDGDTVEDRDEAGDEDLETPAIDTDGDEQADFRDTDSDDDTIEDGDDNCRLIENTDQSDEDDDGVGDVCDDPIDDDPPIDDEPPIDVEEPDSGCDCQALAARPAWPSSPLALVLFGALLLWRRRG